jgi:hypothetical protein
MAMAAGAVRFRKAAAFMELVAAMLVLAAVVLDSPVVRAMEEGCGSSHGSGLGAMSSDLAMIGHGRNIPRVQGFPTLDVEEFILQDNEFRAQHAMNMEVLICIC